MVVYIPFRTEGRWKAGDRIWTYIVEGPFDSPSNIPSRLFYEYSLDSIAGVEILERGDNKEVHLLLVSVCPRKVVD